MKYLLAAFNARPMGMPIPPNWLGLGAIGLLGFLAHPGFLLIGLGLEVAYLGLVASNRWFQTMVDAAGSGGSEGPDERWAARRLKELNNLTPADRAIQQAIEARCAELVAHLTRLEADPSGSQAADLAQLCWLHLRLLSARGAIAAVVAAAQEGTDLAKKRAELDRRLADPGLDAQVRSSLEGQLTVIAGRLAGHAEARTRLEFVEAELERLRQQVELAREQGLLATDAEAISRSVNVLSATMGEAGRWLRDQQELLGGLDSGTDAPPVTTFLSRAQGQRAGRVNA